MVDGTTSISRKPPASGVRGTIPAKQYCDADYVDVLVRGGSPEELAQTIDTCASKRSPVGRTPLDVVNKMVQLAKFQRQVEATGAKKEWVALVMKTLKNHPKLSPELLTEQFAVKLGNILRDLPRIAKGKEEDAFRAFYQALEDSTRFDFDGAIYVRINDQLARILGTSTEGYTTEEGIELLTFLQKDMNSGNALSTLDIVNKALEKDIPRGIIRQAATAHQPNGIFALGLFVEKAGEFRKRDLMKYMEKYEAGMELAKSLGANALDPEICLNFAYAISTVGVEVTTKLAKELGIEHFRRYTPATLNAVYLNLDPKNAQGKPLLFINDAKADDKGSFYSDGKHIELLTRHYRLIVLESGREEETYARIKKYGGRFGPAVGMLTIAHGTPEKMALSNGSDEKNSIDLTDANEWKELIAKYFVPDAIFGLISCSTGRTKDSVISVFSPNGGKTTAFAPTEDARFMGFELTADGAIIRPLFSVPSRQMVGGIPITVFAPTLD